MHFSIIVAVDEKMGIGIKNGLPWHLSSDLKHFARMTKEAPPGKQNAVIMGRRTWESLPEKYRPLQWRVNVVVTGQSDYIFPSGVLRASSLDSALAILKPLRPEKVFIIGGARLFKEAMHHPDLHELYVTHVFGVFPCDVFFPHISEKQFKKVSESPVYEENGITFRFDMYKRV